MEAANAPRRGLGTSSPVQFGQVWCISLAQAPQNVHSKLHTLACPSGSSEMPHRSQASFMSNIDASPLLTIQTDSWYATSMPDAKAILAEHLAAEARRDASAAASTYLDDGHYENLALGLMFRGRAGVEMQYQASYDLMPDLEAEVLHEIWDDDSLIQMGRFRGSASGELLGIPVGGGRVDQVFVAYIKFRAGQMVSEQLWYDLDEFCMAVQVDAAQVRLAAKSLRSTLEGVGDHATQSG